MSDCVHAIPPGVSKSLHLYGLQGAGSVLQVSRSLLDVSAVVQRRSRVTALQPCDRRNMSVGQSLLLK